MSMTAVSVVRMEMRGTRAYWLLEGLEPDAVWVTKQLPDPELAAAWAQGRRTGSSRAMRMMSDEHSLVLDDVVNPYKKATS